MRREKRKRDPAIWSCKRLSCLRLTLTNLTVPTDSSRKQTSCAIVECLEDGRSERSVTNTRGEETGNGLGNYSVKNPQNFLYSILGIFKSARANL
jgi:hypothetical protein